MNVQNRKCKTKDCPVKYKIFKCIINNEFNLTVLNEHNHVFDVNEKKTDFGHRFM